MSQVISSTLASIYLVSQATTVGGCSDDVGWLGIVDIFDTIVAVVTDYLGLLQDRRSQACRVEK